MADRARTRVPWAIWGLAFAGLAVAFWLSKLNGSLEPFVAVAVLMIVGYVSVGALIASRQPGNATGWLFMMVGIGFLFGAISDEWVTYAYRTAPGSLPLGAFMAWLSNWVLFVAISPLVVVAYLYPTGALPSRRWRPVLLGTIGALALGGLATILKPGPGATSVSVTNPTGIEALADVATVVQWAALVGSLAGAVGGLAALVVRFRNAPRDERQQIGWLVFAVTVALVAFAGAAIAGIVDEDAPVTGVFFWTFLVALGIGIPAAAAVAILKYRLYDLDLVIKKTVVFGILVRSP